MRSGLPHDRDEVDAVRITHDASVVLVCLGPFAVELPPGGDVVVHNVHTLVFILLYLVVGRYGSNRLAPDIKPEGGGYKGWMMRYGGYSDFLRRVRATRERRLEPNSTTDSNMLC